MNSDPYDSAAWRTLGMLDADESAIFDEAMHHDPVLKGAYLEMDRLTAAIAAACSTPIAPKAGQLERLQSRLGLNKTKHLHLWLAITGWSAAAVLAAMLVLDHNRATSAPASGGSAASTEITPATAPTNPLATPADTAPATPPRSDRDIAGNPPSAKDADLKAVVKVETKRLVQEIEVLRDNLEKFQHRDRVLFEPVPGMALPIIMKMNPPNASGEDAAALAANDSQSPVQLLLSDTMKLATDFTATPESQGAGVLAENPTASVNPDSSPPLADAPAEIVPPSAIPIYDAARDSGTLVVSNLPAASPGKVYNLWVTTHNGEKPVYVGSLPPVTSAKAETFDFSLGSNMVIPSGFTLTQDPEASPASPSAGNTVLQGPPTPTR